MQAAAPEDSRDRGSVCGGEQPWDSTTTHQSGPTHVSNRRLNMYGYDNNPNAPGACMHAHRGDGPAMNLKQKLHLRQAGLLGQRERLNELWMKVWTSADVVTTTQNGLVGLCWCDLFLLSERDCWPSLRVHQVQEDEYAHPLGKRPCCCVVAYVATQGRTTRPRVVAGQSIGEP